MNITEKQGLKGKYSTYQTPFDPRNGLSHIPSEVFKAAWENAIPTEYYDGMDNYPRQVRRDIFDLLYAFLRIIVENFAEVSARDIIAFDHLRLLCDFLEYLEPYFQTSKY